MRRSADAVTCALVVAPAALLVPLLLVVAGCGSDDSTFIEGTSLRTSYIGMGCDCGTIVLRLEADGSFILACGPPDDHPYAALDGDDLPVGGGRLSGSWESRGGDLTLAARPDAAVREAIVLFTECEVEIEAVGRSGLLPGLRWVSSTRSTFADSTQLVARDELDEFLRPKAGSGSRTSAL